LRRALIHALWAAALAAWITCPPRSLGLIRAIPRRYQHFFWWTPSLLIALEYVTIVAVAALSGAAASYGPRLQWGNAEVRRNIFRATSVAIWMAPFLILLVMRSALTGLVASGMVITGFLMLRVSTKEDAVGSAFPLAERSEPWQVFQLTDVRVFALKLAMTIIAAALLEAALLANLIAEREYALFFFVAGAALLAAQLLAEESMSQVHFPAPSRSRALLSTATATLFVIIGLLPLLGSPGSRDHSFDVLLRSIFVKTVPAGAHPSVRLLQTSIRSDGYIGVILTPKRDKREEARIPPITLATQSAGFSHQLTIRFTGSYWFFQSPFLGPPIDSVLAEGDPATVGVRSSNYKPLLMEAVQNLDEPVDTDSLEHVQLAMVDADPYPGTVSVELVLVDTHSQDHLQSLGVQWPNAIPVIENARTSHSDTLAFAVPTHSSCKRFNQIRLIFRLDPSRSKQGAAIVIQSFVLSPRGP